MLHRIRTMSRMRSRTDAIPSRTAGRRRVALWRRGLAVLLLPVLAALLAGTASAGAIRGQVTGPEGKALADAQVILYRFSGIQTPHEPSLVEEPLRTVIANAAGGYAFDTVPPGAYRVVIRHGVLAPAVLSNVVVGDAGAVVDLKSTLRTGRTIRIRTIDENGNNVPGVPIEVRTWNPNPAPYWLFEALRTDASGQAQIGVEPGSTTWVWATPQDYCRQPGWIANPDEEHLIRLVSGRTIRGVVQDSAGFPVADVEVRAQQVFAEKDRAVYTTTARIALTDREGRFELKQVRDGSYYVVARGSDYGAAESGRMVLHGSDLEGINLTLSDSGSFEGQVQSEDGAPVADALVILEPDWNHRSGESAVLHYLHPRMGNALPVETQWSGNGGVFRFRPLPSWPYQLTFVDVSEPWNLRVGGSYSSGDGETIDGVVGASLNITLPGDEGSVSVSEIESIVTNVLRGAGVELPEGLDLESEAGMEWFAGLDPNIVEQVEGALQSAVEGMDHSLGAVVVTGQVVTPSGEGSFPARVTLRFAREGEVPEPVRPQDVYWDTDEEPGAMTVWVDHTGAFQVPLPMPASRAPGWELRYQAVAADGRVAEHRQGIAVEGDLAAVKLVLGDGGVVTGRVTDAQGFPVKGARVLALKDQDINEFSGLTVKADAYADGDGRFRLIGLDARHEYQIGAWSPDHGVAYRRGARVGGVGMDLKLPAGGTISGQVLDSDGKPAPGQYVQYSHNTKDRAMAYFAALFRNRSTVSGLEGRFEFRGVESTGAEQFTVSLGAGTDHESKIGRFPLKPGEKVANADLKLLSGTIVTGRVTVAGTGEPIAGARVGWSQRSQPLGQVLTAEDGGFTLRLNAGSYGLTVEADGYATAGCSRVRPAAEITIKEGDETPPLNLELARESVVLGTVTSESGDPLVGAWVRSVEDADLCLDLQPGQQPVHREDRQTRTKTDENGQFAVLGASVGSMVYLRIETEVAGEAYKFVHAFTVSDTGQHEERIEVSKRIIAAVRGVVLGVNGQPVADGKVKISEANAPAGSNTHEADVIDGRFEVRDLMPGVYGARYTTDRGAVRHEPVHIVLRPRTDCDDVTVTLTHEPAAAAPVAAVREKKEVKGAVDLRGVALPDYDAMEGRPYGTLTCRLPLFNGYQDVKKEIFSPVSDFAFNAQIIAPDLPLQLVFVSDYCGTVFVNEVAVPSSDNMIRPQAKGQVAGKVVDAQTSDAIPAFQLGVIYPWDPANPVWSHSADGTYRVDGLGDFSIRAMVIAEGYAPGFSPSIVCRAARETPAPVIRLSRGVTARGVVRGPGGQLLSGARISFHDQDSFGISSPWGKAMTGEVGRFVVENLRAGSSQVTITHPECADLSGSEVLIVPNGGDLQFALEAKP